MKRQTEMKVKNDKLVYALNLLTKHLFALFASKDHFGSSFQLMVGILFVALRTVAPSTTALGPDRHLNIDFQKS